MINAQELRIGNTVEYYLGDDENYWALNTITTDDISECLDDNKYFNEGHRAIPLTEDWLIRFGFFSDARREWWSNGGMRDIGNITTEDNFEFDYHPKCLPVQLKYVHQLQNLYFALTGTELTLK